MALRKLVAGNWKMFGSRDALAELDGIAAAAKANTSVDVAICPPFTLIHHAAELQPDLLIGAQDCHFNETGAHTGNVSAVMVKEAGARLVIVGHSERRDAQCESDADVQAKAKAVIAAGLTAIVCVGESEAQRLAGEAEAVVSAQVRASVPADADGAVVTVAYEPIWAIGTGRTPTVDDVAEMHARIRATLVDLLGEKGNGVRILYGGSVKPSNAAQLLAVKDVDGALVGGASLKAADFVPIIEAAAAVS
ncbi:triose-phosphate isomerase [Sphingomonas sp. ID0503]|uniref:triose-phosphate isomerase n=1 Tax=Sphingomonas sp. ID0503 TaxID=3399691 RepID=UPI003AFA0FB6